MEMDPSPLRDSTKYPPGYGDFALHCSDNVICYFPRHLLEYMSPVFKDMFSLAAAATDGDSTTKSSQPPLKISERAVTIEALLEYIDPKGKRILSFHPDTMLELLEAARKYQISTVTDWFVEQAGIRQIEASSGKYVDPFTTTYPDLALKCALRFDFPRIGQLAIRTLAGGPSSTIVLESTDLPSRVYKHLCQLRDVRVERYRGYISEISRGLKRSFYGSKSFCSNCLGNLGTWIINMERTIADSPRWDSFMEAYETTDVCKGCGNQTWPDRFRGYLLQWEDEATEAEAKLPEWPY